MVFLFKLIILIREKQVMDDFLNFTILEKNMFEYYSKKNIDLPKVEVYRNFTLMLNNQIQKNYVGDEFMDSNSKKEHFIWCWKITCDKYKEFNFQENVELFNYLRDLFRDLFYRVEDKNDEFTMDFFKNIKVVIEGIFNYVEIKTPDSLAIFIDIYNVFENKRNNDK